MRRMARDEFNGLGVLVAMMLVDQEVHIASTDSRAFAALQGLTHLGIITLVKGGVDLTEFGEQVVCAIIFDQTRGVPGDFES